MSTALTSCQIEPLETRRLLAYTLTQLNLDALGGAGLENELKDSPDVNTAGSIAGRAVGVIFEHATVRVVRSGKPKLIDVGNFSSTLSSLARGLNDNNQFAGDWTDTAGTNHAFFSALGKSDKVTLTKLGDVKGMAGAIAYALNNSALVVGSVGEITGKEQATAWVPAKGGKFTTTLLPRLANSVPGVGVGQSIALDVNDKGTIAGYAVDSSIHQRAVIWTKGSKGFGVTDLGAIAGGLGVSFAYAINSAGVVAGSSSAKDFTLHAVLFAPNSKGKYSLIDLGGPGHNEGAAATDINTAGVVVGQTNIGGADENAALWTGSKGKYALTDLNKLLPKNSGWVLNQAISINDAGVILGSGVFNGGNATFMLTPKGKGSSIQLASTSLRVTPAPVAAAAPQPTRHHDIFSGDPIDISQLI